MDLKPWECQVCQTCYQNPDRRPRTLPCGHNFCTPCLRTVRANLVICCPTCRASHLVSTTNDLPINYDLEVVAQTITNTAGMAKLDAPLTTPSETGHDGLDGVTETHCNDQGAKDDAKSKSQFNENNNLEKDTIAAVKSVTAALRKDRTPGLSRRLRASLKEQQQRLQESIKACQEVQEQLNQYRSALTTWTQQHKDLIKGLADLQQQNQQALQQLQNEDERVVTMQEEGQQDMNQLTTMLATLDAVTTPQEAFIAANDADCYSEEAEEWRERALQHFPELKPVQQAAQVRSVTAAALSKVRSQPLASVQPNPELDIMQKVRIITDSVASAQIGRGDVSTTTEIGVPSSTTTQTSPATSSSTPSSDSAPTLRSKRAPGQTDTSKTSPNSSGSGSIPSPPPKPDHSSQTAPRIAESRTSTTKNSPVPTPKSKPDPKTPSAKPASTTSTSTTPKSPPTDSKVTSKPSESSRASACTSSEGSQSGSTDDFSGDMDVDGNSVTVDQVREMGARVRRLVQGGRVYAVRSIEGRVHSSRLTLKNDRVYLRCLSDQPPPHDAVTLPIGEAAGGLDVPGSSMAFLELSWAGQRRGTVHISLKSNTSLAKQFILLCTGQLGHSYLNTNFIRVGSKGQLGEYIIAGDYEFNDGTGGAHLLPSYAGKYSKSDKAGAVLGWHTLGGNRSAQFAIITKDGMRGDGKKYINVFGEVESGMQTLRLAAQYSNLKEVEIVDCGVVLNV